VRRTDDDARGFQIHFDPVRAEVALGSRMRVWIYVDGVIRARQHAGFAADTSVGIKIDDPVSAAVQRMGWANLDTRRIVAVVAPHHAEMPTDVGKLTFLDVFHPGPEHAHRNVMLLLAGHRAGVAPDTTILIDYKSVPQSALPAHHISSRHQRNLSYSPLLFTAVNSVPASQNRHLLLPKAA
jgi:hypothetical protein